MTNILKYLLLFAIHLAWFQQPAHAANYNTFYVFGDSLSDTGNDLIYTTALFKQLGLPPDFPAIPPSVSPHKTYYEGRFSNGPMAFEYLWQALQSDPGAQLKPSEGVPDPRSESAVNFAFGGSGSGISSKTPGGFYVPGALGQVDSFLEAFGQNAPKKALYAIWTGANDYLLGTYTDPARTIANIRLAIKTLYSAGARYFLVPNLPDLSSVPILNDSNIQSPASAETLHQLTLDHNAALASALKSMRQQHPGIKLISVDIYTYFNQLKESLNTGTGPGGNCLFTDASNGGGPYTCSDVLSAAPGYLFWDVEHPTTEVHQLMSSQMLEALKK
jgi:phospholipase/lecithinase/hemolysin